MSSKYSEPEKEKAFSSIAKALSKTSGTLIPIDSAVQKAGLDRDHCWRFEEPQTDLYKPALEQLRDQIRTSTTSVTSVPKPLKFLRPHFARLKAIHAKITDATNQKLCADVISALAMTLKGDREVLKYRLLGLQDDIGAWGQEYVKHVSHELGEEWTLIADDDSLDEEGKKKKKETLLALAKTIVNYNLHHNSEVEACDLLMEIGEADLIPEFADEATFARIGLYLTSCVPYLPDPENSALLRTAQRLYLRFDKRIEALLCAIMLCDVTQIKQIFFDSKVEPGQQMQMALLLGRHQIFLDIPESKLQEQLTQLNSNSSLAAYFGTLARELDILDPKHPDDIYKAHLEPSRPGLGGGSVDSAKVNLANTFVNGFVNTGYGSEKLMGEEPTKWFYKNKEYGMLSAAASLGLINRWDVDSGLSKCDANLYSTDDFIKAGSMLAIGIISSGVNHECDPAQALLLDYLASERPTLRIGAVFGLGLAYANSKRDSVVAEVLPKLREVLQDKTASAEILGLTGLSIGLIAVGTGDADSTTAILTLLKSIPADKLTKDNQYRFLALAVGLIHLQRQNAAEKVVTEIRDLPSPFGPMAGTLVDVCAYAGTGNVLKIQELLHICSEHHEPEKEKDKAAGSAASPPSNAAAAKSAKGSSPGAASAKDGESSTNSKSEAAKSPTAAGDLSIQQAVATLGIGLIAMGEDIGSGMSARVMGMLMRYGEPAIRRAVPLALALTSISNPQLSVLETLSKFSHDMDSETASCAIFALGLVGAGTNNARLGNMLRQLAVFHARDSQSLMLVRIAQGLTHLGKGTMTLNPFHWDRQLLCPASAAALFATAFAFLDVKNTVLGPKQHYLLYALVPAIQPRHLLTFTRSEEGASEPLEQVNVSVRVGQAVDVVGQAGKPKGITGFQTQTTPVLLAHGERAELATDEWIPVSPVLEGLVILRRNPDFDKPVASSSSEKK